MSEENSVGLRENQEYNAQVRANTAFLEELKNKLPEYFTTSGSFDLEKFQENLKENNIDELSSGYQLDFIGKNLSKKQAGERPSTVIVPDIEHNEKTENKKSENIFLTGDNLEVLRHLQSAYQNSIDFIYIDPPYNTGSDGFVYSDKFEYTDEQLKDNFALTDKELERLKSIQGKSTHSAWLTFMYPRLYLAKKLLKDSGVIFVSIDDNEQANLKLLMDEIFGEGSFVSEIVWKGKGGGQDSVHFVPVYESIFVYAKNIKKFFLSSELVDEDESDYKFYDNSRKLKYKRQLARKWGSNARREDRPNLYYGVIAPDGSEIFPRLPDGADGSWRHNKSRLQQEIEDGDFEFIKDEKSNEWVLYQKMFQSGTGKKERKYTNLIDDVSSGTGAKYLKKLFDGSQLFDYPKPVELVKRFLSMVNKDEFICLDFFAGSATTADAVMKLNAEDGGNRKFIMTQLSEVTPENSVAKKSGYTTIDQISRERIKRAGEKIKSENPLTTADLDTGFKHYRFVEPAQRALDQIEFDANMSLDLFDDMISLFSSENLSVDGKATGFDTLLQTYLLADNYTFGTPVVMKDFAGTKVAYANNTRLYIITDAWSAENTKALVNAIGTNELTVQTIVVYGYTLPMEAIRELEIALNQLETKVNLQIRY